MKKREKIALSLLVGIGVVSQSAQADLVANWTFDSGFTATTGGATYDGVQNNGATIDAGGKFGGAANFDKALEQYVQVSASPFTGGDYSYSAWYRNDADIVTDGGRYFVLESGALWAASYGLRVSGGAAVGNTYTHTTGGAATNHLIDNGASTGGETGQWHNIVVTYNGTTGILSSYLDGSLAGSSSHTGTLTPTDSLVIGGHRAGTTRNFHGLIDDVAVFDHVLRSYEIDHLSGGTAITIPDLPQLGDTNGDDIVDLVDYVALRDNFGTGTEIAQGDVDFDGDVDQDDFWIIRTEFPKYNNGDSLASAIPEPTSLALIGLGGLFALKRRK